MWRDSSLKESLSRRARVLATRKSSMSAEQVYEELLLSAQGTKRVRRQSHDRVIFAADGAPLLRIKFQRAHVALVIPVTSMTSEHLDLICDRVSGILSSSGTATTTTTIRRSETLDSAALSGAG